MAAAAMKRADPNSSTKRVDEKTPDSHPEWFTPDGALKWKATPAIAAETLELNAMPREGALWCERYRHPKTNKWVYNYTAQIRAMREDNKFEKNRSFRQKLEPIRTQIWEDLEAGGRRGVIALAVAMIDHSFFRVGGTGIERVDEEDDTEHRGVTTLCAEDLVALTKKQAVFEFIGKSAQEQEKVIDDPDLVRHIAVLAEQAENDADRLLQFEGVAITARDVNAYLKPFGVTAKEFRTFHATRLAFEFLVALPDVPEAKHDEVLDDMYTAVAEKLGHTKEVCKASYVDPTIEVAFRLGKLKGDRK